MNYVPNNNIKKFTLTKPSWEKIKQLKNLGYSFTVTYTQRTCKINISDTREIYLSGGKGYTMKEFSMQKQLKKRILDNIASSSLIVPEYSASDVSYNAYSKFILEAPVGTEISNVIEYDINKAYYQCAFNLGYIDEMMYSEYINLPKHIRLRFIGTIATRKRVYTFKKGVRQNKTILIEDKMLRNVWFHICKRVDDALKEFKDITGGDFLMYYVDGIYLNGGRDYTKELKYIQEKYGFSFKKEAVEYMKKIYNEKSKKECFQVLISKYNEQKGEFKEKPFTIKIGKQFKDDEYADVMELNFPKK